MKNLILIISLCIFMFSCFEREEEITVIDEKPIENPTDTTIIDTTGNIVPIDSVDIMQCETVKQVMNYILSNPPREPRAYATKYIYNNEYVLYLTPGGTQQQGSAGANNADCKEVCEFGGYRGNTCPDFWEKAVFIDTVWVDRR